MARPAGRRPATLLGAREQAAAAGGQQALGGECARLLRRAHGGVSSRSHADPSGRPANVRTTIPAGVRARVGAQRRVAARLQGATQARSASRASQAPASVIARTASARARVVHAPLHTSVPWPGRRHELVQDAADLAGAAQPLQAGRCEHERCEVVLREAPQARVDVAPHDDDLEVLAQREQLRRAPQRGGPHPRARRERRQRRRAHERVERIAARRRAEQRKAVGQHARHVLGAVHREVDVAASSASSSSLTQRSLSLTPEPAPVAEARSPVVTTGRARAGAEQRRHGPGLRERERAPASPDAQAHCVARRGSGRTLSSRPRRFRRRARACRRALEPEQLAHDLQAPVRALLGHRAQAQRRLVQ